MLSRLSSYLLGDGYQQQVDEKSDLEKAKEFAISVNSLVPCFPETTPTSLNLYTDGNRTQIGFIYPDQKVVYLSFYIIGSNKYKITRDNDLKLHYDTYHDGDGSEALVNYLTGYTATLGDNKINYLAIHGKKWPLSEILNIESIRSISDWGIEAGKEIYDGFMDYMSRRTDGIPYLKIVHMPGFQIPAEFYKSRVFRDSEQVMFEPKHLTIMDEEDFLMAKSWFLEVMSSQITDSAFNKKLHQWYGGGSKHWAILCMDNWDDEMEKRMIDKDVILENLPFTKLVDQTGQVTYTIARGDGDMVDIMFPDPPTAVTANFNV